MKKKPIFIRVDQKIIDTLNRMKQPSNRIPNHNKESHAYVLKRLLKEHWEEMMQEKEDVLK